MAKVLDEAHITSIKDNKYMCQKIGQFRKWQNKPIGVIAKSLHKPPKTIHMLEDGELLNNKLLLKEAQIIGMGRQHVIDLANQTFSDEPSHTVKPFYNNSNNNTFLFNIIHSLAIHNTSLSEADICHKAHKNTNYLNNPCKMPVKTFVKFAWILGKSDEWIIKILDEHNISTKIFQKTLYGRILRYCLKNNLTLRQMAQKAGLTVAVFKRIRRNQPIREHSKKQILNALNGKIIRKHPLLTELIQKHGYSTLSSFSRASKISLETLSGINSNAHVPSIKTLKQIASVLNISLSDVKTALNVGNIAKKRIYSKKANNRYLKLKMRLDKLTARVVAQNNNFFNYKGNISKRIKALNQAIDYGKLGSWISASVNKDIQKEMPKYAAKISPCSLEIQKLEALYEQHPKIHDIVNVLLHADAGQINAIYTIIQTWQHQNQ